MMSVNCGVNVIVDLSFFVVLFVEFLGFFLTVLADFKSIIWLLNLHNGCI